MSVSKDSIGNAIQAIMDSPSTDFGELMKVAGLDPKADLRWMNLSQVDFGSNDVAGWDFSGARLHESDLSRVRNIKEAIFTSETEFTGAKLPEGISITDLVPVQ